MKIKRTLLFPFLTATAGLILASCGGLNTTTSYSPSQIAEAVIATQTNLPILHPVAPEDDYFSDYLSNFYQIDPDMLADGVVYYADGVDASEIAVLILADAAKVGDTEAALQKYLERRAGMFTGYVPKQAALVEQGIVATNGSYVALFVCEEPQKAKAAFLACFAEDPPELSGAVGENADAAEPQSPGEIEEAPDSAADAYDPDAVLTAWRSGDASVLTEKNRSILNACSDTIGKIITEDMTDYEKELAVHDWIIRWADYDEGVVSQSPSARPDPDNENPYGLLLHQASTCWGYTSTFQLFMDMLDIECITVEGFSDEGEAEHAWNMVRLDGEWYCVDVTWDDPVGLERPRSYVDHTFFNVTSQFLRDNDHWWDEDAVPEATATAYSFPSEHDR